MYCTGITEARQHRGGTETLLCNGIHEDKRRYKNERDTVQITQAYLPHDLDMKTVENLRNKLLEKGDVKRAYIAIKEDKSSGQFPVYIILVKTKAALREITNIRTHEHAADELIP